ncbi:MAG: fumarate hydratase [Chloroflexi bacterium]|nr:fumarate hydratase [Chloroflexota bacterium]
MREIHCEQIMEAVARLCIEACYQLPADVLRAVQKALQIETSEVGREFLRQILQNADIARCGEFPLCQDTGFTVVFLELGQDVHIVGGDLNQCIVDGVRHGYREGYLRKSVVRQPYSARINTQDNTPPVIHIKIVPGDRLKITVMPKGGGSENKSYLEMMTPAMGRQGIIDFVVRVVDEAGADPCPPVIVGVGIGGTADYALLLAKEALLREVGKPSENPEDAALEAEILQRVNSLGIGPQGLGGNVTALAVHVNSYPCHIASLPVAVNLQCHSARHKEVVL